MTQSPKVRAGIIYMIVILLFETDPFWNILTVILIRMCVVAYSLSLSKHVNQEFVSIDIMALSLSSRSCERVIDPIAEAGFLVEASDFWASSSLFSSTSTDIMMSPLSIEIVRHPVLKAGLIEAADIWASLRSISSNSPAAQHFSSFEGGKPSQVSAFVSNVHILSVTYCWVRSSKGPEDDFRKRIVESGCHQAASYALVFF